MPQKVLPVGDDLEPIDSLHDAFDNVNAATVAIGETTDAPASGTVPEDATARSGISLWKGIKNILALINGGVGADITTPTAMPAGGAGLRGWASAIWTKLNASLAVTGTFWQTTQPTSDAGPGAGAGVTALPVHGDFSTATAVTAAPTSGQKWCITDIVISAAAAAEVQLQEETSNTIVFGPILMPANGYAQFTLRGKLKLPTVNKKVMGKSSTADHVTIQVSGVSEA